MYVCGLCTVCCQRWIWSGRRNTQDKAYGLYSVAYPEFRQRKPNYITALPPFYFPFPSFPRHSPRQFLSYTSPFPPFPLLPSLGVRDTTAGISLHLGHFEDEPTTFQFLLSRKKILVDYN